MVENTESVPFAALLLSGLVVPAPPAPTTIPYVVAVIAKLEAVR